MYIDETLQKHTCSFLYTGFEYIDLDLPEISQSIDARSRILVWNLLRWLDLGFRRQAADAIPNTFGIHIIIPSMLHT